MLRLDKLLSDMGLGTRSQTRAMVRGGRVSVDGRTERDPGAKVDEKQARVMADGAAVNYQKHLYVMLNKPAGYLSARRDLKGKTVMELLPPRFSGLFPAGRLDIDTVGLLLLTDDGDFAHAITSPRRHVDKKYLAQVDGPLNEDDVRAFAQGIVLENGENCRPAGMNILSSGESARAEVTLREGKFHQVKRMFLARGRRVTWLKRLSIGGVMLDPGLKEGEYRPLAASEIAQIFEMAGKPPC